MKQWHATLYVDRKHSFRFFYEFFSSFAIFCNIVQLKTVLFFSFLYFYFVHVDRLNLIDEKYVKIRNAAKNFNVHIIVDDCRRVLVSSRVRFHHYKNILLDRFH